MWLLKIPKKRESSIGNSFQKWQNLELLVYSQD